MLAELSRRHPWQLQTIKLIDEVRQNMKPLIAKLVWPAYLAGVIFLSYTGVNLYLNASSILKDHTVVEAPMEFINTTSRTKRGHTSVTYNFNYSYTVAGEEYGSRYSAVNKHGERYLEKGLITLAYSNTDPAKAGPLHLLKRQSSLGGTIKGILIFALILGLVALFVWGWALPDEDDEDPSEDVDSNDTTQTA